MMEKAIKKIFTFSIFACLLIAYQVEAGEVGKRDFTEKIEIPADASGDSKFAAYLMHKQAYELLKEYKTSGDLDKLYTALNLAGEALVLNPEESRYWVTLGDAHSEMAKFNIFRAGEWAEQAYQEAIALNPEDTTTMVLLGVSLAKSGDYKEALQYLEPALTDDIYLMTYAIGQWLNLCYLAGSQTKRGTIYYEEFLNANPEFYYLRLYKALLYKAHFDYVNAEKELKILLAEKRADSKTKEFASNILEDLKTEEVKR